MTETLPHGLSLQQELKQLRPFGSPEEEAGLNLARTAALLAEVMEGFLKSHGVSAPQYNVLRILRGAGEAGLGRNEIRGRLLSRMPDVTRLLSRLEEAGLVTRERSGGDRRYVPTRLTPAGLDLVNRLDDPVQQGQQRQFAGFSPGELASLSAMLTRVRGNVRASLEQFQTGEP